MSQIAVDIRLCKKDGVCVDVCPARVLGLDKDGFPREISASGCIQCGHCVAVCPNQALTHSGLPSRAFLPALKDLPSPALIEGFLMSRRSVRVFKDRPVARETLEAILDVARRAPTASNSQKLHWIVVGEKAKVHDLAQEIANGMRNAGSGGALLEQWENGYDFALRGAPAVVVACAPEDYKWGKQDCAIALTFMELAAEARGLGACWAGYLTHVAGVYAPLGQALLVPDGFVVCGGLMLGESKYRYRRVPPRKPLSVQWI